MLESRGIFIYWRLVRNDEMSMCFFGFGGRVKCFDWI
jgi:hypothetical protein